LNFSRIMATDIPLRFRRSKSTVGSARGNPSLDS
jgi:hypothetical protein